jgi:hypothetical protein
VFAAAHKEFLCFCIALSSRKTPALCCIRQHPSAYVRARQHFLYSLRKFEICSAK